MNDTLERCDDPTRSTLHRLGLTMGRVCQSCGSDNLSDAEYCAACGVAIDTSGSERPWLAALIDDNEQAPEGAAAPEPGASPPATAPTDDTTVPYPAAPEPSPRPPVSPPAATTPPAPAPAAIVAPPSQTAPIPPPRSGVGPWVAPTIAVFVVIALATALLVLLATNGDDDPPGAGGTTVVDGIATTVATTAPETTETTAPATTAAPGEPGPTPADDLAAAAAGDLDRVLGLQGRWVPQLSAKRDGTEWEGITYDLEAIRDLHQQLDAEVGGALLAEGSSLAFVIDGERMAGWWITLADVDFDDPDDALAWCRDAGFDRANCAARLLTDDDSATGTLRLQAS